MHLLNESINKIQCLNLSTTEQNLFLIMLLFSYCIQVLYRCHSDYQHWVEHADPRGEPIRRAKDRVLEAMCMETGLYLDRVNSAGG